MIIIGDVDTSAPISVHGKTFWHSFCTHEITPSWLAELVLYCGSWYSTKPLRPTQPGHPSLWSGLICGDLRCFGTGTWVEPSPAQRQNRDVKRFLRFFSISSHFHVFDVFLLCQRFFLFCFYFCLTHSQRCSTPCLIPKPQFKITLARQSIVAVVCVSACNCKPRNYLW